MDHVTLSRWWPIFPNSYNGDSVICPRSVDLRYSNTVAFTVIIAYKSGLFWSSTSKCKNLTLFLYIWSFVWFFVSCITGKFNMVLQWYQLFSIIYAVLLVVMDMLCWYGSRKSLLYGQLWKIALNNCQKLIVLGQGAN